jgi:hypothetical protein
LIDAISHYKKNSSTVTGNTYNLLLTHLVPLSDNFKLYVVILVGTVHIKMHATSVNDIFYLLPVACCFGVSPALYVLTNMAVEIILKYMFLCSKEHISYKNHNCPLAYKKDVQVPVCPLCNTPVPTKRGEQPDIAVGAHIDNDCTSTPAKARRKVTVKLT